MKAEKKMNMKHLSLRLETLETRQLLSGIGFGTEEMAAPAIYSVGNVDTVATVEETQTGDATNNTQDGTQNGNDITVTVANVVATSTGRKVSVEVSNLDAGDIGDYCTVVTVSGTSFRASTTKLTERNAGDGSYTYSFNGQAGKEYDIYVVVSEDRLSSKDIKAAIADGSYKDYLYGESWNSPMVTKPTVKEAEGADSDSIVFTVDMEDFNFDLLFFNAKFDGAKEASEYYVAETEDGFALSTGVEGEKEYAISYNAEAGTVQIDGLQKNTRHTLQVKYSRDMSYNVFTDYSNNCTLKTTKDNMPAPTDVKAELVEGQESSSVKVTWVGEEGVTYTIKYTDADGRVRTATTRAKVEAGVVGQVQKTDEVGKLMFDENGEPIMEDVMGFVGEVVVNRLKAGTEYTFSVIANKDRNNDASVAVNANDTVADTNTDEIVKTYVALTTPSVSKVSTTDTTATFQIRNWDKVVKDVTNALENVEDGEVLMTVKWTNAEGNEETFTFYCGKADGEFWYDSGLFVSGNGKTATFTIYNLVASTKYNFEVTVSAPNASSAKVAVVRNVKTQKEAYATPVITVAQTEDSETSSLTISDSANNNVKYYTVEYRVATGDGTEKWKTTSAKVSNGEVVIKNLKAGTLYEVKAYAQKSTTNSESLTSESVFCYTKISTPKVTAKVRGSEVTFTFNKLDTSYDYLIRKAGTEDPTFWYYDSESKTWTDGTSSFKVNKDGKSITAEFAPGEYDFEFQCVFADEDDENTATSDWGKISFTVKK